MRNFIRRKKKKIKIITIIIKRKIYLIKVKKAKKKIILKNPAVPRKVVLIRIMII